MPLMRESGQTLLLVKGLAGVCLTCSVGCPADAGPIHLLRSSGELFIKQERKQTLIKSARNILHPGLDAIQKGAQAAVEAPCIVPEGRVPNFFHDVNLRVR